MKKSFFDEMRRNRRNTYLLIGVYTIILGIIIGAITVLWTGRQDPGTIITSFIITTIIITIYSMIVLKTGDKAILSLAGAKPVTKRENPYLYHTVEGLSIAAGLKKPPKCYIIEDDALNAFATGTSPENSAIAVTRGLLNKLNRQELEGVIAHEMSHIRNYDTRYMIVITLVIGLLTLMGEFFLRMAFYNLGGRRDREGNMSASLIMLITGALLMIAGPLIGQMIRFAVSREREYLADAGAVELTRYPPGLRNALIKIKNDPDPLIERANKTTANLFIANPFRKKRSLIAKLFSTHPPIEERIKRLEEL